MHVAWTLFHPRSCGEFDAMLAKSRCMSLFACCVPGLRLGGHVPPGFMHLRGRMRWTINCKTLGLIYGQCVRARALGGFPSHRRRVAITNSVCTHHIKTAKTQIVRHLFDFVPVDAAVFWGVCPIVLLFCRTWPSGSFCAWPVALLHYGCVWADLCMTRVAGLPKMPLFPGCFDVRATLNC